MISLRSGTAVLLLTAAGVLSSACSSDGESVLALTVRSDADIGRVESITVNITPDTAKGGKGDAVTKTYSAADLDAGAGFPVDPDGGVIVGSFFVRIPLGNLEGTIDVVATPTMGQGALPVPPATTEAEVEKDGAVAARVTLTRTPPPTDGGADAEDDAGAEADGGADAGTGADAATAADAGTDA